jgi:hypothetical protein
MPVIFRPDTIKVVTAEKEVNKQCAPWLLNMNANPKRPASSPAEKMASQKKVRSESTSAIAAKAEGSLVKFEVVAINDATYYGVLAEIEILYIWEKVLGRSRDEIFAMSYNRSLTRNFRVTFKLNSDIETSSIYPEPTFEYHRKKPNAEAEDEVDILTCRFVGYNTVKPAEIGQLTRITVKTNDFAVRVDQIVAWLSKFGSVSTNYQDFEKNSLGIRSDVFETEIALRCHVPEYLPIDGRKVLVNYPGIPKLCNNCYQTGHVKRSCSSKRVEWVEKVKQMRESGDFPVEMFGGWNAIIDRQN